MTVCPAGRGVGVGVGVVGYGGVWEDEERGKFYIAATAAVS